MQLSSDLISVSGKLHEVSGFQVYELEGHGGVGGFGQVGRKPNARFKLEAKRDLHYAYFHWHL